MLSPALCTHCSSPTGEKAAVHLRVENVTFLSQHQIFPRSSDRSPLTLTLRNYLEGQFLHLSLKLLLYWTIKVSFFDCYMLFGRDWLLLEFSLHNGLNEVQIVLTQLKWNWCMLCTLRLLICFLFLCCFFLIAFSFSNSVFVLHRSFCSCSICSTFIWELQLRKKKKASSCFASAVADVLPWGCITNLHFSAIKCAWWQHKWHINNNMIYIINGIFKIFILHLAKCIVWLM